MKKLFASFIAVTALILLCAPQQAMADVKTKNEPMSQTPRLLDYSYFTGTIGNDMHITMYLEVYSSGEYIGWYYYNKNGSKNKLALVGAIDDDGLVKLLEYNKDGVLTAGFEGTFNKKMEFVGIMYVVHSKKRYSCKLYPANF